MARFMADIDFDVKALSIWLDQQLGDSVAIEVAPIRGGGSCELFEIKRGTQHLVLRRAPVTAVSSTAHNVLREYRIIASMQDSQVRVPKVYACCEDNSVAGAAFYIMEYIDGEVIRRKLPPVYLEDPAQQSSIGEQLIDALVELHGFDWQNSAMVELSRPDKFLSRQVDRWLSQYQEYQYPDDQPRDLPGINKVATWLSANQPPAGELAVMHGDYKIDNTMMSKDLPPRVLRIVDFEMTTVGDPLIDLAWAMIFWPEEGNLIAIAAPGTEGGLDARYCQSPQQLVQRYADKTGCDLAHFQWYQAFAAWKLGIVLEASYAKFLKGESKNPAHELFGFVVDQLMLRAERFAIV